jgi:hypothetical protein
MRLGSTNCFSTLFKQVNPVLNKYEDPNEALDYSYTREVETLTRLHMNIVELRMKENMTGISEGIVDAGMATNREAEDKTEKMKPKAQALEELIDSCLLRDYTSTTNNVDTQEELQRMTVKSSVKEKLVKSISLNVKKQTDQSEINEDKTQIQKMDEQEEPVVAE